MLPKRECDAFTCLQSLIGLRADCKQNDCFKFYFEDIEGVDIHKLAQISGVQSLSGKSFAYDLIDIAAREMLSDIEFLFHSGYSLQETFGDYCASNDFITNYTNAGGIKVTNNLASNYSLLKISKLDLLTNYTGTATLVIDDLILPKSYTVELIAGTIIPVILSIPYQTSEKNVKIYFEDNTIGVAQINTSTTSSGCNCGGSSNRNAIGTISYSGIIGSLASTIQYGFKACASVQCSTDLLTCELVKQIPNIFGLTLLYKCAEKYYSESRLTQRINRTASLGDEKKVEMSDYYAGLYQQRLRGTRSSKGIATVIGNYLKQRKDKCVVCNSTVLTAWATG